MVKQLCQTQIFSKYLVNLQTFKLNTSLNLEINSMVIKYYFFTNKELFGVSADTQQTNILCN